MFTLKSITLQAFTLSLILSVIAYFTGDIKWLVPNLAGVWTLVFTLVINHLLKEGF